MKNIGTLKSQNFLWNITESGGKIVKSTDLVLTLWKRPKKRDYITQKKLREIKSLAKTLIWRKKCWFFHKNRACVLCHFSTYSVAKQKNRCNAFFSSKQFRLNFFSKNVDLTEKMMIFAQKSWSLFHTAHFRTWN